MSIQRLKPGQEYRSRSGKHFVCIWSSGICSAKLVCLENGFSFIAQCTEIRPDGTIAWIEGSLAGHKFGEIRGEDAETKQFFPNGYPWEKDREDET